MVSRSGGHGADRAWRGRTSGALPASVLCSVLRSVRRPWLGEGGLHGGAIIDDASRERGQEAGLCIRDPGIQIRALAVLDHVVEPV